VKDGDGPARDRLWIWSMITLMFGTLVQLVKIYAMRGVSVTQTLAAMYFVPFLVMEALKKAAADVTFESDSMLIITKARSDVPSSFDGWLSLEKSVRLLLVSGQLVFGIIESKSCMACFWKSYFTEAYFVHVHDVLCCGTPDAGTGRSAIYV
jgi:hypothetical protein